MIEVNRELIWHCNVAMGANSVSYIHQDGSIPLIPMSYRSALERVFQTSLLLSSCLLAAAMANSNEGMSSTSRLCCCDRARA
jgi:hypothetical protein